MSAKRIIRISAKVLFLSLVLVATGAALPETANAALPAGDSMFIFPQATYGGTALPELLAFDSSGTALSDPTCATPSPACLNGSRSNLGSYFDSANANLYFARQAQVASKYELSIYVSHYSSGTFATPVLVQTNVNPTSAFTNFTKGPDGFIAIEQGTGLVYKLPSGGGDLVSADNVSNIDPVTGGASIKGLTYDVTRNAYYFTGLTASGDYGLYSLDLVTKVTPYANTLVGTFSADLKSAPGYGLAVDSSGKFWTTTSGYKVETFSTAASSGFIAETRQTSSLYYSGWARIYAFGGLAIYSPPTYSVTYKAGTGSGADSVNTVVQGDNLTLADPNTMFTPPAGTRQNGWQVTSGTLSSGSSYPMTGSSQTPTSNLTLTARWTGGPLIFSTNTSFDSATAMSTIAFPSQLVGASETMTVYVKNSGSLSTSFSNGGVSGDTALTLPGGGASPCNLSGTTLAAGAVCSLVISWAPTSGNVSSGSKISIQVSGSYYDEVLLTGTILVNHTVSFNANSGSGTMSNQIASVSTALTSNAFTRSGYTFAYWTPDSAGTGLHYLNGANYDFLNTTTMYAQWTQNAAPAAVPDPKQTDEISKISYIKVAGGYEVTISGRFDRHIYNIDWRGSYLSAGSWTQTSTTVKFVVSAWTGTAKLVLFNGAVPMLNSSVEFVEASVPTPVVTPTPSPSATATPSPTPSTTAKPSATPSAGPAKIVSSNVALSFAEDSAVISASNLAKLSQIVEKSAGAAKVTVTITGYVRPSSNLKADQLLSTKRAKAVEVALKNAGLKATYSVVGAGRYSQAGAVGRRVEVVITYTK